MEHYVFNYYNKPPCVLEINTQPSMTQQHFTEECDINQILRKFIQTGILDTIGPGVYADISDGMDYQSALHMIKEADEMFLALPSEIRKRFNNSPAEYMDFVHDPANLEEGIQLGIFTKNPTIINQTQATTTPSSEVS